VRGAKAWTSGERKARFGCSPWAHPQGHLSLPHGRDLSLLFLAVADLIHRAVRRYLICMVLLLTYHPLTMAGAFAEQ
jgi:hypothetical protein